MIDRTEFCKVDQEDSARGVDSKGDGGLYLPQLTEWGDGIYNHPVTARYSESSLFRRFVIPKVRLLRTFVIPKVRYSEG